KPRLWPALAGGLHERKMNMRLELFAVHGAGAAQEEIPLASITRESRRALELRARLGRSAELREEVAANGRQEGIRLKRRLLRARIDDSQPRRRSGRHRDRDRAIQLDDRRRRELTEVRVEGRDAGPIRV